MPKSVTTHYCDVCGQGYADVNLAVACEKKHKVVSAVSSPEYERDDKKSQYPTSVLVTFKDGTNARYYRKI